MQRQRNRNGRKFAIGRDCARACIAISTLAAMSAIAQTSDPDPLVRGDQAKTEYQDAEGRLRSIEFDRFGQLESGTNSAGLQTTIERDARGNGVRTELPSGAIVSRAFDGSGNVTSMTDETLGGTSQFMYDAEYNQLTAFVDAFGEQFTAEYDARGNQTRVVSALGRETTGNYRADGLLADRTNPQGTTLTIDYDADAMPITLTNGSGPDARSELRSFTAEGYLDTVTDAEGHITDYDYDLFGRLTNVVLPGTRNVALSYDSIGNLVAVTPPGGSQYGFEYNELDLLVREIHPAVPGGGSNQTDYSYNLARQVTRLTRADGITVDFTYDSAGRLSTVSDPRGNYVFSYSASSGLLSSTESPDAVTVNFAYLDDLVDTVSFSGAVTGDVSFQYDVKGRVSNLTIAGQAFPHDYSADDNLILAGNYAQTFDAISGLRASSSLDTVDQTFDYNPFAELERHTVTAGAAMLYDVQYTRDRLGRITQIIETILGTTRTIDYGYDLAGRLATVTEDGTLTATYTYDSNDNRTNDAANYDAQDRLTSTAVASYGYSAQGERTQTTAGPDVTAYRYDASGALIGVTLPGNTDIDYLLDGQGRYSVKRLAAAVVDSWIYVDPHRLAARLTATGVVTQRYLYADTGPVPAYIETAAAQYVVISDHLGSVRLVVDASDGSVVQRIDYDAWGAITADTNPGFQPFGFAGGHYDPDTGLTRFGPRHYDAATAHWMSKDPIGFLGSATNLYRYASSDPVNRRDSSGLKDTVAEERGDVVGTLYVEALPGNDIPVHGVDVLTAKGESIQLRAGDAVCAGDVFDVPGQIHIGVITEELVHTEQGNQILKVGSAGELEQYDLNFVGPTAPTALEEAYANFMSESP